MRNSTTTLGMLSGQLCPTGLQISVIVTFRSDADTVMMNKLAEQHHPVPEQFFKVKELLQVVLDTRRWNSDPIRSLCL